MVSGDHFDEHMDAVHEPNMVASLSVELLAETPAEEEKAYQATQKQREYWERNVAPGLTVEGKGVAIPTAEKPLSLAMFWHDCK